MKINLVVKTFLKKVIKIEILNVGLRKLLKLNYIYSVIPKTVIERIPVAGKICIQLLNSEKIYFKVDGNDTIVSRLYWKGVEGFEKETISLFMKLLKFTDTVLDIGANTGAYALIAATDNFQRKVYAFEPVPKVFKYLKRNVELNKADNLQINSSAITNYDGDITLYITSAAIPKTSSTAKEFKRVGANEATSVRALTVDSFVTMNNISKVDLIKIDTETTEHLVLQGANNVLQRDEPIIICEVLKGKTEKLLHSVLDNTNYKYFWISSEGLVEKKQIEGDLNYKNMNYLFITQKRLDELIKQLNANGEHLNFIKISS